MPDVTANDQSKKLTAPPGSGTPDRYTIDMKHTPFFVGLDVGGTTMKGGVVDDTGQALSAVNLPTEAHRGQEFGLERMCETIRHAVAAARLSLGQVTAIGVATPGLMDIP